MSKIKMEGRELLLYLSLKYKGEWQKIYDAIKNKETVEKDVAQGEIDNCGFNNNEYITIIDPEYPEELKTMNKPPFVLYLSLQGFTIERTAKEHFDNIFNKTKKVLCVLCQGSGTPVGWNSQKAIDILTGVNNFVATTDGTGIVSNFRMKVIPDKLVIFSGKGIDKSAISLSPLAGNALYVSEFPNGVDGSRENFERRSLIMTSLAQSALAVGIGENSTAASGLESMEKNGKQVTFLVKDGYQYEDPSEKSNGMIKKLMNIPSKTVSPKHFAMNDSDIKALNKELTEDK